MKTKFSSLVRKLTGLNDPHQLCRAYIAETLVICRVHAVKVMYTRRFINSTIGSTAIFLATVLWPLSSRGADPADVDIFLASGSCPGCDLSGAFLDAVVAEGGDIWNANLRGASLYKAQLSQANLSGTDLTGANLTRAYLDGADLSGAIFAMSITTGVHTDKSTTCPDGSAGPCLLLQANR